MFENARFRRLLRAAGSKYVANRSYDDFSVAAALKLRRLHRQAAMLALLIFAHDVRCTVAKIVEMFGAGTPDEAARERMCLNARILDQWAFKKVSLENWRPGLFELAEPLGLGLGAELESWLRNPELRAEQVASWLERNGQRIERFTSYFERNPPK